MPSHRGKAQGTLAVRFQKKMDAALDKAERFLSFVADHCETVWDQEALVYLQSRGFECDDQITALFESWKADEQAVIDEYNQGIDTNDLSALKANTINIAKIPEMRLRDFWDAGYHGEYSTEPTMLRTFT